MSVLRAKVKMYQKHKPIKTLHIAESRTLQKTFSNAISVEQVGTLDPDKMWLAIKRATIKAVNIENKTNNSKRSPEQTWISRDIQNTSARELYRHMTKDIQRSCRVDKNNYYRWLCQSIQQSVDFKNSKQLFQIIKSINKHFKMQSWNLLNEEEEELTSLTRRMEQVLRQTI